jgi:cobalamin biosynthesis protein CbiM
MHIPDGFIDIPTSAAFGTLALAGTAIALKKAKTEVDDRTAPMAGLTAVFIFAVQMLNFPVAAGTSGHLLGGALAMVLVGPYAASLAITVVLGVQALLFADGGLTALGLNVFNLSVIAVLVSFLVFKLMVKLLPKTKSAIPLAAGIAAFVSVPISASAFTLQYAIGGNGTAPVETVLIAMFSTHLLIGIGEAVITMLTVSAILASRSDLVYGWSRKEVTLEIRSS